ncbi:hypothetical protein [Dyadobacter bucti]|uniref:hypothetical protein n=1 Tax=Dyadobacter bucti TaxID=2572203 RepID=UPI0011080BD7|nr:hypothetical protein [Dyadobacter bucti]
MLEKTEHMHTDQKENRFSSTPLTIGATSGIIFGAIAGPFGALFGSIAGAIIGFRIDKNDKVIPQKKAGLP